MAKPRQIASRLDVSLGLDSSSRSGQNDKFCSEDYVYFSSKKVICGKFALGFPCVLARGLVQ